MAQIQTYNYHPPLPLPDPESPEQSLGDCAICMDAILIDPTHHRHSKSSDSKDKQDSHTHGVAAQRSGGILSAVGVTGSRKSYSLAPCHHLFVRGFMTYRNKIINAGSRSFSTLLVSSE